MKNLNNAGLLAFGAIATALTMSGAAIAEPLGLLNGRSADVSRMPEKSVEAGVQTGENRDLDFQYFGARFNYKVNPNTVAYVDLGQAEFETSPDIDGLAYGLGAFFQLDGVLAATDLGVHASYHRSSLEASSSNQDEDLTSIMVEALFSGREAFGQYDNFFWNASVGFNRAGGDGDSDTELTFSGGVTMENASRSGQFYVGIIHVDDLAFGGGYRHYLN